MYSSVVSTISLFGLLISPIGSLDKLLLIALEYDGTIYKQTVSAFDPDSAVYQGKKTVHVNQRQILGATFLAFWANELHSSLVNESTLGLGNLDFFSKL